MSVLLDASLRYHGGHSSLSGTGQRDRPQPRLHGFWHDLTAHHLLIRLPLSLLNWAEDGIGQALTVSSDWLVETALQ
jgi:hypothetical protein